MSATSPLPPAFLQRFFDWAMKDSTSERESGFPLISRLRTWASQSLLWHLQRLDGVEQQSTCEALVRMFHPEALASQGLSIREDDRLMVEAAARARLEWRGRRPGLGLDRSRFAEELLARMKALGHTLQESSNASAQSLVFWHEVGPWTVSTSVLRDRYWRYSASLLHNGQRCDFLTDIQTWLGVSSGTEFDLAGKGDEAQVAGCIAEASSRLLDAVAEATRA